MFDQAPQNLPTEPEDILAGSENTPTSDTADDAVSSSAPQTPATALSAGRLRPATPVSAPIIQGDQQANMHAEREELQSDVEITPPILNKKNLFVGAIIVLVLLIAGGAIWVWRSSKNKSATPSTPVVNQQQQNIAPVSEPTTPQVAPVETTQTATSSATSEPQALSPAIDSDGDGLTDQQEIQYGTDPQKADTDGDNLTDYEEIFIYHTNPLNPDTDGDGFSDGQEVKNGYNPNGSGRLLNIPTSVNPTNGTESPSIVSPTILVK